MIGSYDETRYNRAMYDFVAALAAAVRVRGSLASTRPQCCDACHHGDHENFSDRGGVTALGHELVRCDCPCNSARHPA